MRPPAPKAGSDVHETKENDRFPALTADASASASPKSQNEDVQPGSDSPAEPDIIAALAMLERLPLSDAEKAEAVRRLLARGDA